MKDHDDKKNLVKDRMRRQAQQSAKDLVSGLTRRARQDVHERLRQLDRDRFLGDEMLWSPPCGTRLDTPKGLEKGVVALFARWSTQARRASARGDKARSMALVNRLTALPLDTLPQLRRRLAMLVEELR